VQQIIQQECTIVRMASAPCRVCGERVFEDVHVVESENCALQLYCGNCCPVCSKDSRKAA
jgi:hypothetical protein